MTEEKKGHAKITIEFEVNEALMEMMKETAGRMPEMVKMWRSERAAEK